jgi:hypothetical protein
LVYAKGDMATLKESIVEWESRGILKIIKMPEECGPDDICVKLHRFIDQKGPIKNWLNWNE